MHKSGFVNIIGNPNVGKSTLVNALIGDKLSIISSKPQTTRHRILGIWNDDEHQVIFSDSPGIIQNPKYSLQQKMNSFAYSSFEDGDIILFVTDIFEKYEGDEKVIKLLNKMEVPKYLVINKIDQEFAEYSRVDCLSFWSKLVDFKNHFFISAKEKIGVDMIIEEIKSVLPEGPEYFPKDQWTDKTERFFASEIIRNHILRLYKQEIPYSCEVNIDSFKEGASKGGPIINISAQIYVERKTQKAIIIGKNGEAIKKLGTEARKDLEEFFQSKIFLQTNVSVKEDWRNNDRILRSFGYSE
ncbi:MAG TPA: GTPase Era [Saprospiraceae bacterium]|nr:GTPase Era [Saprospiraceae bacterium]